MMSDWAAEKKALFDSALPDTALPGPAGQLAASDITAPYSPAQLRSTMPTGKLASSPVFPCSFLHDLQDPGAFDHSKTLQVHAFSPSFGPLLSPVTSAHTGRLYTADGLSGHTLRDTLIQRHLWFPGAVNQAQYGPSHATGLHGRMKSYAETLQKLNEADTNKQKISAVDAFASAAAAHPDGAALLLPCLPLAQLAVIASLPPIVSSEQCFVAMK